MKSLLTIGVLACAASAFASDDLKGLQLSWDNDLWGKGRTDRWYTNGLRITGTYKQPPKNELSRLFQRGSQWFLWDGIEPTLSYSLGQTMYTPRDITRPVPPVDDRPWGAFLYFSITAHASQGREFRATELKLGTTGRYALGEEAQKLVHRITSSPEPQGWSQQLKARPGLQLTHARVYRHNDRVLREFVGLQTGYGLGVGTLRGRASVDVSIIVGDLSGANAPLMVGNEGDFVVQDFEKRDQYKKVFGFVSANLTAVGWNYFLDGRTPYGHPAVDPKRFYTVVNAGVSLPLNEWGCKACPRLVYSQSTRSAEFVSRLRPDGSERRQRWGTLAAHWDLD